MLSLILRLLYSFCFFQMYVCFCIYVSYLFPFRSPYGLRTTTLRQMHCDMHATCMHSVQMMMMMVAAHNKEIATTMYLMSICISSPNSEHIIYSKSQSPLKHTKSILNNILVWIVYCVEDKRFIRTTNYSPGIYFRADCACLCIYFLYKIIWRITVDFTIVARKNYKMKKQKQNWTTPINHIVIWVMLC